jgi:hypothetical protein
MSAPQMLLCPSCHEPLVLLSIENYPRLADMRSGELGHLPGDIRDALEPLDTPDAKFAVVDRNGEYFCLWCNSTQKLQP